MIRSLVFRFGQTLFMFLTILGCVTAQDKVPLNGQSGINLSYQLTKLEESDKRDRYKLVVVAENTNPHDVYYTIAMKKQQDGQFRLNTYENMALCEAYPKNATGLMGVLNDAAKITGEQTKAVTKTNEVLFKLSRAQVLTSEVRFAVKPGQKPEIVSKFNRPTRKIEEYDMTAAGEPLTGAWISNCGNVSMTLKPSKNDKGQDVIYQTVNGRQNTWLMISENVFEKPGDKQATVTFNRTGNIYTYTNMDGAICIWSKK
jgi:hypothetical protein